MLPNGRIHRLVLDFENATWRAARVIVEGVRLPLLAGDLEAHPGGRTQSRIQQQRRDIQVFEKSDDAVLSAGAAHHTHLP